MPKIRTPSRLHLSLIDMNGGIGRVDGGIGIALEEPFCEMAFAKANEISGVEGESKEVAERVCLSLGVKGVRIKVSKRIPSHVGFGSNTQHHLAIAAGIYKAYGIHKPIREMAKLVGRGGTSGIGVEAFEKGGFILDGGHDRSKGFAPSSFSDSSPPPILARYDFPWWLVCAWPDLKGAHDEREKDIFEKHCPIAKEEVGEVSRIVLMKMLPSLVEKNIVEFGESLNLLQETGFKKIEIGLQDPKVWELLRFMKENSPGAGMSSFGPVCFSVCETQLEAEGLAKKVKEKFAFNVLATKASSGAKWL